MSPSGTDGGGGVLFEVGLREGVWQVSRDGQLFGHYRSRAAAVASARDAARLPLSGGAAAQVVVIEDDFGV